MKYILISLTILLNACVSSYLESDYGEELETPIVSTELQTLSMFSGSFEIALPQSHRILSGNNPKRVDVSIDLGRLNPLVCSVSPREDSGAASGLELEYLYYQSYQRYHGTGYLPKLSFDFEGVAPSALVVNRHGDRYNQSFDKASMSFYRDFLFSCRHNGAWDTKGFNSYVKNLAKTIAVKYSGRSLLSKRVYKLKTSKTIRGFEIHYLWKKGQNYYSEKILSSINSSNRDRLVALDRYERVDWDDKGQLFLGEFRTIRNQKIIYDLKLNPKDEQSFVVSGAFNGKNIQKRISSPRFPVIPFLDAYNTVDLDRISIFDPNHRLAFISAALSSKKANVLSIKSKFFKSFVYMNSAGVPKTVVYRHRNQNYFKILVYSHQY